MLYEMEWVYQWYHHKYPQFLILIQMIVIERIVYHPFGDHRSPVSVITINALKNLIDERFCTKQPRYGRIRICWYGSEYGGNQYHINYFLNSSNNNNANTV